MNVKIPFNKTKIVATVGPACNSKQMLKKLVIAGADVFRLNFSHGEHAQHEKVMQYIREVNDELGTYVATLQDLQGPKIRIGMVEDDAIIKTGDELIIVTDDSIIGNTKKVGTSYLTLAKDVKIGDSILIDDAKIEIEVKEVRGNEVITTVVHGGPLKSRKGMNLPQTDVSAPSLTEKDEVDLDFGLEHDVDWVALSFVRSAKDVIYLKERIKESGKDIRIIAKIEKPEAVKNIDEIIEASDGVMVARGDLGVEVVMEEVPMIQKMIVAKCKLASKPVIIATQMMESMIENPRPTRAETNDVANAVMDGSDAIMLSAETAAGKFPIEAVSSMVRTIFSVEGHENCDIYFNHYLTDQNSKLFLNDTIVLQACRLAKATKADVLVGMTMSGYTAFKMSSYRPKGHIFIFTPNRKLLTTFNLIWGVRCYYYDNQESTDSTISDLEEILFKDGHVKRGSVYISATSMPIHKRERTNTIKINVVS